MSLRRFGLVFALFVAFAACTVFAVLRVIAEAPAPTTVQPQKPLTPRLTRHLLLVIVDGLRYDVATDPARMPHFSEAMARETSGEIWAGRISMTTAAIRALGTGQRGRLEQIVRNLKPTLVSHNSWLENAKNSGLRVAAVGDRAWFQSFGTSFLQHRDDPEGVAIDVDFNPQTFRDARELLASAPDFLVLHFVTPDHQGHAYGVSSERYSAHIRNFDRELHSLLAQLDSDWTVVVTSDHGASDAGKHGTDVAVQRRSPIYARGPGIRPGIKLDRPLDQLELAATLPSLLGVSAPAHGTGAVTSEWFALSDVERADVACTNAEHVLSYARSVAPREALEQARSFVERCRKSALPEERTAFAARSVAESDRAVELSTGLLSPGARPWLGLVLLLGLALAILVAPGAVVRSLPATAALLVCTVAMVVYVERLPGLWPDRVRVVAFVVGNAGLLLLLLRPARVFQWLERLMPHAPAWLPGLLVLSYPANVRPESYVVLAVCALAFLPFASPWSAAERRKLALSYGEAIPAVFGLVSLLPVILSENEGFSRLIESEQIRTCAAAALLCAWFVWQRLGAGDKRGIALSLALAVSVGFVLRAHAGPLLGRVVWAVSALAFVAFYLRRGRAANALCVGVLAFAWLARDFEVLPLLGAVTLAEVVGRRLAASSLRGVQPAARLLVQSLFAFALAYALRMGIQDGLEFGGMDFRAGAFSAPNVSVLLVGSALVYKYALGLLLLLAALRASAPPDEPWLLPAAVLVCFVARGVALSLMFFVGGNSYWTALRVLGDLPTALAMGLGAVLALGALCLGSWTFSGAASTAGAHEVS